MKYVASVSFGKDSLAMLLKLIEKKYPLDYVVFYDTGMEFECIYALRDKIKPMLKQHNIEFIELKPKDPFLYTMLERPTYSKQKGQHNGYGWCGGLCRWGTTEKLKAIRQFKKSLNDDVIDYVGIAADEPKRFDKAKSEGKILPLVEWGMTEKDCLDYCYGQGYSWIVDGVDLYSILDRVSCWCCANKNLKELRNIYQYLPNYWDKLKYLQDNLERPMKGYYKGKPKGIYELEERFRKELEDNESISKSSSNTLP